MKTKAIIPAAGFGTRMNMLSNQSKEMLTDPNNPDKYLIDYSLDLCYKYKIEPVVISRLGKVNLNSYLRFKEIEHIVLKEPGKEWAETVLKSQGLWGDKNILILPDTRWDNSNNAFERIVKAISYPQQKLVIGNHIINPEESTKWGTITESFIHEKKDTQSMEAWGIIGFDKYIGLEMFSKFSYQSSYFYEPHGKYSVLLKNFKDITREGKLEKY